jgi:hypothetical protein
VNIRNSGNSPWGWIKMKLTKEEMKLLEKICEKHQIKKDHLLELIKIEEDYQFIENMRRIGLKEKLQNKIDEWEKEGEIV